MFDRESLPRVLPFLVYIVFLFVADVLGRLGMSAADLRWLYPVKVGVVLAILLAYRRHYTELSGALSLRAAALAVVTGVVVLVLWINLDASWMLVGSAGGFDPRTNGAMDWPLTVLRLLGATLVVPVMEELFWRSFLLRWIDNPRFLGVDPRQIKLLGIVATVILFGFEHTQWLAGIVAGLAYTLLYMHSRVLASPILSHAVTNGLLGIWVITTGAWSYW